MLAFDHASHGYRWCDQPIPSVTGVLKRAGYGADLSFVAEDRLEAARIRGVTVHDYVEAFYRSKVSGCAIGVDWRTSPYAGYIESFLLWEEVADFWPRMVEHHVVSVSLWCAGRLDAEGVARGFGWEGTVDFKSRPPIKDDFLQCAGYQLLAAETIEREGLPLYAPAVLNGKRAVVGLLATGRMAKQITSTDPLDQIRFARAVRRETGSL